MLLMILDFITTIRKIIKPCSAFAISNMMEDFQTIRGPTLQAIAQLAISAIHVSPITKNSSTTIRNLCFVCRFILSLADGAQTPKTRAHEARTKKTMLAASSMETGAWKYTIFPQFVLKKQLYTPISGLIMYCSYSCGMLSMMMVITEMTKGLPQAYNEYH